MAELDKRHLLKSAYNYTQAGQWDRALEEYRKLIRGFPEDPNIHSMVADLLAKKADPAGAAREHVEAARLYKASGADDKELNALRKALRVQAGDTAATQALQEHVARSLALAQAALASGKLDAAEAIGNRLLDAEPSSLAASGLLDTVRAARLAEQARLAMEEEAGTAEQQASVPDAAAEVLARLEGAVQGYLAAEDYDNAIETLMVMLKLDPGRVSLQLQLAQAQAQLIGKQQAQAKWSELQIAQREQPIAEAREIVEEVDLAAWRDEEEAVRRRLEEEQRLAEDQARHELAVVEAAVRELEASRAAQAPTIAMPLDAAAQAGAEEASQQEEARLKALLEEREALQRRVAEEQAAAARREQEEAEAKQRAAQMQAHAEEMTRQQAEAQAKAEALRELEARLAAEREAQRKEFEAERARLQAQEEALRAQLTELMRSEMQRMQAEVREQALQEIRGRIQAEEGRRQALESEAEIRVRAAEAAAAAERDAVELERRRAEEAASAQRDAVTALKRQEDERKAAMLEEAVRRRAQRQGAGEGRSAVLKNSRRISDVLHAATTRHLGSDIEAQLEAARRYLKQDLLLDAMRLAQKMAEQEPDNEKVKELLKVIIERKGL